MQILAIIYNNLLFEVCYVSRAIGSDSAQRKTKSIQ